MYIRNTLGILILHLIVFLCNGQEKRTGSIVFEYQKRDERDCGVNSVNASDFNVADTLPYEYPWTLQLLRPFNETLILPYCGATLIHPRIAITAAYCISQLSKLNRIQDITVRGGEWNTSNEDEVLPHQDRKIIYMSVYSGYNMKAPVKRKNHDIALILVDEPFLKTKNVRTICLPSEEDTFEGKRCVVSGWGKDLRDDENSIRTIKKKVDLPVWSVTDCRNKVNIYKRNEFLFPRGTMCAGGEENKDTCQGDGGSGLACLNASKKYTLAGIVSWAFSCGVVDEPGVYTDVAKYRKWIDDVVRDMKTNYRF